MFVYNLLIENSLLLRFFFDNGIFMNFTITYKIIISFHVNVIHIYIISHDWRLQWEICPMCTDHEWNLVVLSLLFVVLVYF